MNTIIEKGEFIRLFHAIIFRIKHAKPEQKEYWLNLQQELIKYDTFQYFKKFKKY
jgi:hypothetical protein